MRRYLPLVAAALAACGAPEHQNPFDPSTPASQQARATLTGTVQLESVNGVPPPLADVRVAVTGPRATLVAFTDPTGVWTAADVPVGMYSISATKAGYRATFLTGVQVTLDDGGTVLPLPPLALVAGRGEVSGVVKLLLPDLSEELAGGAAVSLRGIPGTAQSARDGAYLLSGVPAGDYVVDATKYGYRAGSLGGVGVTDMAIASVATLQLDTDPGLLSGTVTRNDGGDVRLALVRARGFTLGGTPWESSAHPAGDGTYLISNLPAGNYQVTFELTDFGTITLSATIAPARPTDLPPETMVRDTGSILGVARLASATDHSGIVVTLTPAPTSANPNPSPLASAVTDAAGSWRVDLLPVGNYAIDYTKTPGYVAQTASDTIVKGTRGAAPVTLALDTSGAISGAVVLWDNVGGAGANVSSIGAQISIAGTASNGAPWIPAPFITPDSGSWSFTGLPPGTYDVVVSSTGRSCATASTLVVASGGTTAAGSFRCTDAIAPGAVGLGAPLPTGSGISGWVSGTTVAIPIAQAATDATSPASNLRGYQIAVGVVPSWDTATLVPVAPVPPTQLTAAGLVTNATNVVWVRAVDWVGNAGPASSVPVVQDSGAPTQPTITAPKVVPDVSATVVFTGSDADPSFLRYEACTGAVASTAACPGAPACSFGAVPQSYPVALAANQRTCLWARAVDKAGRTSATAATSIVNDSTAPSPPVFRPSYDPTAVTVRAGWVDFFLATAAQDGAWGPDWKGIAWIEVDTGNGFEPLCPSSTCRANDTYNPCDTACSCPRNGLAVDSRLRCDGGKLVALRVPLATASLNRVAIRAVDLAGNAGNGLSQDISTESSTGAVIAATNAYEFYPSVAGNLVSWSASPLSGVGSQEILDLGPNRRPDATDTTCSVPSASTCTLASRTLFAYVAGGGISLRRAASGTALCGGGDTTTALAGTAPYGQVAASGERIAWAESGGSWAIKVREPGPNGTLGDPDDVTTTLSGSYSWVWDVELAGSFLHARTYGPSTGGAMVHRIFSAPGGFQAGVTAYDGLTMSAVPALALAPDGSALAYVQSGAIHVRYPTGGRYGPGDVERTLLLDPGFGYASETQTSIAIDGTHVVLADQPGGAFVHWDAGPDGKFGTGDDVVAQLKPSKAARQYLGLSAGLLVYGENSDVFSLDLTSMRWDDVPAGYDHTGAVVDNASGSVFFGGYNWYYSTNMLPLTAHCFDGRDTTSGAVSNWFSASGDYVVANTWGAGLYLHTRDTGGASPSGCFFTGSATTRLLWSPATTPTYAAAPLHAAVLGETVLVGNQPTGAPETRVYALEPSGAGTSLALAGADPVLLSTNIQYPYGLGLTPKQAVYFCGRQSGGTGYQVCVKAKGAGNLFRGAGAPAEQVLVHPSDAPVVAQRGTPIGGQHVKVSGNRLVVNTGNAGTLVVDAGADGLFNTADDHETVVVPYRVEGADYAIAGSWVAYVDAGPPAGDQIYLFNVLDHTVQQLTFHVSSKTNVTADANGRVWWEDGVFGNTWSIWVRTP